MSFRVGVLTISDKGSAGEREDLSGPAIREALGAAGAVVRSEIVPDEQDRISAVLEAWADSNEMDLIFTTGGTGLTPRDVTPEATLAILEREAPGIAEALRAESLKVTPMAMLSRGVAGTRGRALIVNLPGSPKAVRECLAVVMPVLGHAVEMLHGPVEHSA
jgi:molybdopterin adenylyltransferase